MGSAHVCPVKPGGQRQVWLTAAWSSVSAGLGRQMPPFWQAEESQKDLASAMADQSWPEN
jgi:hypothetical protein